MNIDKDNFTITVNDRLSVVPAFHRRVIDEKNNHFTTTNKKIGFALPGGGHTKDLLDPSLTNFLAHIELVKDDERYTCKFVNPLNQED